MSACGIQPPRCACSPRPSFIPAAFPSAGARRGGQDRPSWAAEGLDSPEHGGTINRHGGGSLPLNADHQMLWSRRPQIVRACLPARTQSVLSTSAAAVVIPIRSLSWSYPVPGMRCVLDQSCCFDSLRDRVARGCGCTPSYSHLFGSVQPDRTLAVHFPVDSRRNPEPPYMPQPMARIIPVGETAATGVGLLGAGVGRVVSALTAGDAGVVRGACVGADALVVVGAGGGRSRIGACLGSKKPSAWAAGATMQARATHTTIRTVTLQRTQEREQQFSF